MHLKKKLLCGVLAIVMVAPCAFSEANTVNMQMEALVVGFTGVIPFDGTVNLIDTGNPISDSVGLGPGAYEDFAAVLDVSSELIFQGGFIKGGSASYIEVSDGSTTYFANVAGGSLGQFGGWQFYGLSNGSFDGTEFAGLSVPAGGIYGGSVAILSDMSTTGGLGTVRVSVFEIDASEGNPQVPVPAAFLPGALLLGLIGVFGVSRTHRAG